MPQFPTERNQTRILAQKVLKANKMILDKFLEMEYNVCLENLVREDSDRERGKAQFIKVLRKLMDSSD